MNEEKPWTNLPIDINLIPYCKKHHIDYERRKINDEIGYGFFCKQCEEEKRYCPKCNYEMREYPTTDPQNITSYVCDLCGHREKEKGEVKDEN